MFFTGLLFLGQIVEAPSVVIEGIGRICVLILAIAVIIGVSLWSKTWIMIILAILLNGPELLIQQSSFSEETKLILTDIPYRFLSVDTFYFLSSKRGRKKSMDDRWCNVERIIEETIEETIV